MADKFNELCSISATTSALLSVGQYDKVGIEFVKRYDLMKSLSIKDVLYFLHVDRYNFSIENKVYFIEEISVIKGFRVAGMLEMLVGYLKCNPNDMDILFLRAYLYGFTDEVLCKLRNMI